MTALSMIVASVGRPSLERTLESIYPQSRVGDEILVSVNRDCPWGHAARNQLMLVARGHAIMFIDDDDAYLPGALDAVRAAFDQAPDRMHLFRMMYSDGRVIWQARDLVEGQVSTGTIVVPNASGKLGVWGSRYAGDFDFAASTAALHDLPPVWHQDVICLVRPTIAANL